MLPKELQDEIDIEINKTSPEMQAFIRDKYFLSQTIETICRVTQTIIKKMLHFGNRYAISWHK